jgi:hypothetical protein
MRLAVFLHVPSALICLVVLSAVVVNPTAEAAQKNPWLQTRGNHIVTADGGIWQGRGANIQDTRSCWACDRAPVGEMQRRLRLLTDDWGANLVRLTMESHDGQKNVADDDGFFDDVIAMVKTIGARPNTYVLLALWHDPSLDPANGFPNAGGYSTWKRLVAALHDDPKVIFGVSNEPMGHDGERDAEVWEEMNESVRFIRAEEAKFKGQPHLISVQGTYNWARNLDYYIDHPITAGDGKNVIYETHIYDVEKDFRQLLDGPAARLPVVIGEFGPRPELDMQQHDCSKLIDYAEARQIPWIAWNFHHSCGPDLLQPTNTDRCGVDMELVPTAPWGTLIRSRLQKYRDTTVDLRAFLDTSTD